MWRNDNWQRRVYLQKVIDDFANTSFIGILTYNISQKEDGKLLHALRKACNSNVETFLITNIPKRFKKYYGYNHTQAAKKTIDTYLKLLTLSHIDKLFDCIDELSNYNVEDEATRIIIDLYGMEAYDESLDYYAELAFQEASSEYMRIL